MDTKNIIIAALFAAVCVLGYMYYEETQRGPSLSIKTPNLEIEGN